MYIYIYIYIYIEREREREIDIDIYTLQLCIVGTVVWNFADTNYIACVIANEVNSPV